MFYVEGIFAWRKGILGWEDRGKGRMDSVFTNDIRAGERTQAAGGLQEGLSLISRTYIKKARPVVCAWNPSSGDRDGREADP